MDSWHIKKHRNDVFRIAVLLEQDEDPDSPASVLVDLDRFSHTIESRTNEWPEIEAACQSLPLSDPAELVRVMRFHFGLLPGG